MSKYTTELRFICETYAGLDTSVGEESIESTISKSIDKLFSFDFPIFDETYRSVLETKIVRHYYTREICEETVGLWKLRLNTKLNEIMPYYNQLYKSELLEFNPLYNFNIERKHTTKFDETKDSTLDRTTKNTTNASSNEKNRYSDTPQGTLQNIENNTYLTNATINDETNNSTANGSLGDIGKDVIDNLEAYAEQVVGYENISASDLLLKFRETFLNIDMMIINELETLFFGLW